MPKQKFMTIESDEQLFIVLFKHVQVASADDIQHKDARCLHCEHFGIIPVLEDVQYGFFDDKHRVFCVCPSCHCGQIYHYRTVSDD